MLSVLHRHDSASMQATYSGEKMQVNNLSWLNNDVREAISFRERLHYARQINPSQESEQADEQAGRIVNSRQKR